MFLFLHLHCHSSSAQDLDSQNLGPKKMKIFNWVHRRFNNKENAKKNGDIDKQFQDIENECNDVFERWGGGILTIGTFGYDPLKNESDTEQIKDVSSDFLYEEDLEIADHQSHDDDDDEEASDEEVEINAVDDEKALVFGGYFEDLIEREEFGFEYMMMEKRARTTLADLFSADHSEDTIKKQPLKKGEIVKDKPKPKPGASSFKKKLKLEEARPIHKLNQLMRKVLKRKIHPAEIGIVNSKVSVPKKCDNINDHASLLPTQDAMII